MWSDRPGGKQVAGILCRQTGDLSYFQFGSSPSWQLQRAAEDGALLRHQTDDL
jgi:hypothetical protein